MNVTVQSVNFRADQRLVEFIQEKAAKLSQFFDAIIDVQVFLRVERDPEHGNKHIEMKLNVPHDTLVGNQKHATFEAAFDLLMDQMARQVKRYKDKLRR